MDVAFVAGDAVLNDVLAVVGIHVVGGEADGVIDLLFVAAHCLGDDVIGDHPAGFADVHLVGPAGGVGEFVFGESPLIAVFADVFGEHADRWRGSGADPGCRTGCLEPDLTAGVVGAFGVFPAFAEVVGGDCAVVVDVGFVFWHAVDLEEHAKIDGLFGGVEVLEVSAEGFVSFRVCSLGGADGGAVLGVAGEAEAEVVGLDASVALAGGATVAGEDGGGSRPLDGSPGFR